MKRVGGFLKATILGGLFVLLPVVLLYLIAAEVMQLAVTLATPIADLFPKGTFDKVASPTVVAILLIVGVSFLFGLLMLAGPGRAMGRWIERKVLLPLPGYSVIKRLIRSLGSVDGEQSFKPALLRSDDGSREIIYLIEDHSDGRVTVMIPWTPTAMAGNLKIVDHRRIEPLRASLAEVTRVIGHWGVGTRDLVDSSNPSHNELKS
jgi:uncharacterized membrane protein